MLLRNTLNNLSWNLTSVRDWYHYQKQSINRFVDSRLYSGLQDLLKNPQIGLCLSLLFSNVSNQTDYPSHAARVFSKSIPAYEQPSATGDIIITGYVQNADNLDSIAGADVIFSNDGPSTWSDKTDSTGRYQVIIPGSTGIGVEDVSINKDGIVLCSPNPTSTGVLTLTYNIHSTSKLSLLVVNSIGQRILFDSDLSDDATPSLTSSHAPGVFFYQIKNKRELMTSGKFVATAPLRDIILNKSITTKMHAMKPLFNVDVSADGFYAATEKNIELYEGHQTIDFLLRPVRTAVDATIISTSMREVVPGAHLRILGSDNIEHILTADTSGNVLGALPYDGSELVRVLIDHPDYHPTTNAILKKGVVVSAGGRVASSDGLDHPDTTRTTLDQLSDVWIAGFSYEAQNNLSLRQSLRGPGFGTVPWVGLGDGHKNFYPTVTRQPSGDPLNPTQLEWLSNVIQLVFYNATPLGIQFYTVSFNGGEGFPSPPEGHSIGYMRDDHGTPGNSRDIVNGLMEGNNWFIYETDKFSVWALEAMEASNGYDPENADMDFTFIWDGKGNPIGMSDAGHQLRAVWECWEKESFTEQIMIYR